MAIVQFKRDPNRKLTDDEPESEIDLSDIPEMTKEDFDRSVRARNVYNGDFRMKNGEIAPRKLLEVVLRIGKGIGHITEEQFNELCAKLPPE